MRRLYTVATHPLTLLTAALGLNLWNDIHDGPTMCGTTRKVIPWPLFVIGWAGLSTWLIPHYCRPLLKKVQDFTTGSPA